MKNKKIFHYAVLIILVFFCSYLWGFIELSFTEEKGSVGYLTKIKYNHFNDTLRYIVFVSLPLAYYIVFNYKFYNKEVVRYRDFFKEFKSKDENFLFKDVWPLFVIFLTLIILEFLSMRAPSKVFHVDQLHDGDFLTPAFNYLKTGQLWNASFPIHGGSDIFYPLLAWKIFGAQTIGAFKVFNLFLIFLTKILSVIFAFQISKFSNLEKKYKIILFVFLSLIILSFSSYYSSSYLQLRDLYALVFFVFFIQCFYKKDRLLLNFLISLIAASSTFLHIDIGIYLCVILFSYSLYLVISKKFNDFYLIIGFFITTVLFIFTIIGKSEFVSFFEQAKHIVLNIDKIHGLKYPQPFFSMGVEPDGSRATKAIVLQLLSAIVVVSIALKKNKYFNTNEKLFFLFFYLYNFIAFKNALGRSDGPHIMASSEWQSIILSYFILHFIINFFRKRISFKFNLQTIKLSCIFFIGFLGLFYINFENIINFKSRYVKTIFAEDSQFSASQRNKMIASIENELRNEECIQNFTIDLIVPYLIKKPTCTKFFSSWIVSGYNNEKKYIKKLKEKKVKYVLYSSPYAAPLDGVKAETRLKYVNEFLTKNYIKVYDSNGYSLLKLVK